MLRRSLLLATCLAACGEGDPPAKAAPRAAETRVRVASYNVWGLPFGAAKETASRMRRLPKAVRDLDPDVVCLQEVWVPSTRAELVAAFAPDFHAAKSDKGGLLVLSRFPISEERFTPYPKPPGLSFVEAIAGKGVLDVVVASPSGPLRVVTSHMVAFDQKAREGGMPTLLGVLGERRDLPMVLAGDLNFTSVARGSRTELSRDYRSLLDLACVDCLPPTQDAKGRWDSGPNTHVGWPRDEGSRGWWRPDHVFYRSGEKGDLRLVSATPSFDTPETALSDHNLLFAELVLSPR